MLFCYNDVMDDNEAIFVDNILDKDGNPVVTIGFDENGDPIIAE